ncbi:hypothetical protein LR48_Vigan10g118500 [Vigna angularis]|uniref:Uncharacterized protein n=1 Tax=Phaseolus angularis TaxID=3914 RepID=A0A0L9VJX5_PHAAN|nr:hypothetical protein LR48_Vigan10g118500 [Vigna angularis]
MQLLEVHNSGSLAKVRVSFWASGESSQRKGTLPSIFNRSKSTQGKQYYLYVCREEDWGWASCESEVVAARSGRGSGELLKLQGDLDMHVWEEIDPKFYKGSLQEGVSGFSLESGAILQNSAERAYVQFCVRPLMMIDPRTFVQTVSELKIAFGDNSLRSRGDRSEVALEDDSGRLLLRTEQTKASTCKRTLVARENARPRPEKEKIGCSSRSSWRTFVQRVKRTLASENRTLVQRRRPARHAVDARPARQKWTLVQPGRSGRSSSQAEDARWARQKRTLVREDARPERVKRTLVQRDKSTRPRFRTLVQAREEDARPLSIHPDEQTKASTCKRTLVARENARPRPEKEKIGRSSRSSWRTFVQRVKRTLASENRTLVQRRRPARHAVDARLARQKWTLVQPGRGRSLSKAEEYAR